MMCVALMRLVDANGDIQECVARCFWRSLGEERIWLDERIAIDDCSQIVGPRAASVPHEGNSLDG
jgi:hypothetical protein